MKYYETPQGSKASRELHRAWIAQPAGKISIERDLEKVEAAREGYETLYRPIGFEALVTIEEGGTTGPVMEIWELKRNAHYQDGD